MQTIFNFLVHTPIYVYFILIYLISVGIRSSKDRIVSFYRSSIILCVFFYLFIQGMGRLQLNDNYYYLTLFVLVFSGFFGWKQVANKKIIVDKKKMLMALPGSYATIILVFIVFATKYYLGYKNSQDHSFILSSSAKLLTIISSGFSFGFMTGRFVNYLYRFKVSEHKNLSKNDSVS